MDGGDSAVGSSNKSHCAFFTRVDRHMGHQSNVRYHHVWHGIDTHGAGLANCTEPSERYPHRLSHAVYRHAVSGMGTDTGFLSSARTGDRCDPRRLLSRRNRIECDHLSGKRRPCSFCGHDRCIYLTGTAIDAAPRLAVGRNDGRCACIKNAIEYRIYSYSSHRLRAIMSTLRP